jgi:hypothetical protein
MYTDFPIVEYMNQVGIVPYPGYPPIVCFFKIKWETLRLKEREIAFRTLKVLLPEYAIYSIGSW